jgi:hypothetical protein
MDMIVIGHFLFGLCSGYLLDLIPLNDKYYMIHIKVKTPNFWIRLMLITYLAGLLTGLIIGRTWL